MDLLTFTNDLIAIQFIIFAGGSFVFFFSFSSEPTKSARDWRLLTVAVRRSACKVNAKNATNSRLGWSLRQLWGTRRRLRRRLRRWLRRWDGCWRISVRSPVPATVAFFFLVLYYCCSRVRSRLTKWRDFLMDSLVSTARRLPEWYAGRKRGRRGFMSSAVSGFIFALH